MSPLAKLWASLSWRQRVSLGVAAVVIAVGLWALTHWNRERDFRPLYVGLSLEDAGAVTAKLREQGIEYRLDESGGTVRVPSEQAADARLRLAGAGLPKTGRIGFELFDSANFGLTEFAEQVNYRRAVEGELERSITTLGEIERARVHISLPKDSVFLESRQEAKASVVVKLRPRARLSPENGLAICHLVASAVERLSPDAVTVLDTEGNLLIRPRRAASGAAGEPPDASLEFRQKIEQDLVKKIGVTLDPLLGAENFRAGASVECELATSEQSEETFDPKQVVILQEQKTEDSSSQALPSGAPGSASNLPRPPVRPASGGSGVSRRTENTSYQPSKMMRHVRTPQGLVKKISVSVLVAQTLRWQGTGAKARRLFEPPAAERIQTIRDLVAAVAGINTERGDRLVVQSLPFATALEAEPPPDAPPPAPRPTPALPPWLAPYVEKMPRPLLIAIGAGLPLTLVAAVVFLLMRRRKKPLPADAPATAEVASGQAPAAIPA
ncbi:MAG: flagellar M-ring protein FliF, partial [Candidatus Solibacter usitatus]|nr:flagellar M-ring protein FliF [Candidatus Solibacter usitatus]